MATNIFQSKFFLYFTAVFYAVMGINHFINPDFYVAMMPSWFIQKPFLNYASGALEIIFGLMLIPSKYRHIGVWGIFGLLMSFWSIHISHLFEPPVMNVGGDVVDFSQKPTYYGLYGRLLFHFVFFWWILKVKKIR